MLLARRYGSLSFSSPSFTIHALTRLQRLAALCSLALVPMDGLRLLGTLELNCEPHKPSSLSHSQRIPLRLFTGLYSLANLISSSLITTPFHTCLQSIDAHGKKFVMSVNDSVSYVSFSLGSRAETIEGELFVSSNIRIAFITPG